MFSQLLEKFDDALKTANQTMRSSRQSLAESQEIFGSPQNEPPFLNPTQSYGNAISFGKADRFKQKQQQAISYSDISQSVITEKKPQRVHTFKKSARFIQKKPICQDIPINPNYAVVKKNTTANVPIMKKTALTAQQQLKKSSVSLATQATHQDVGPGAYFIKDGDKNAKNCVFHKGQRFSKQKPTYQDNPLFINDGMTKKRPPTYALLKPPVPKPRQLITLKQQDELRLKLQLVYYKSIPLDRHRLLKTNIGPVWKQPHFQLEKMKDREQICAMWMLLDRMNYQRGGLDINIRKDMVAPCAVKYRKSQPKPFKFSEMEPGPDYYYPRDDLIKPGIIGFSFGKEGEKQAPIEYDNRDYQINDEIMKKGGNIVINPEHKLHKLTQTQIRSLNRGPGYYDCLYGQVEKRNDVGVIAFQPITQSNARQNNCIPIPQVNDGIYYPSYEAIDPKVSVPMYHAPADVKPKNLPDKLLFPEHWLFYDGDIGKVRAEIAKNVLMAGGLNFKEYKQYSEKMNRFKEYLQEERRGPDVAQYDPAFTLMDAHTPTPTFALQPEKTLIQPIVKPEGSYDGDNLILHPTPLKDHLPDLPFNKHIGRYDNEPDYSQNPKEGDRLLLSPNKPQKKLMNIIFEKMEGRQEPKEKDPDDHPLPGDALILNPTLPSAHQPTLNFAKMQPRNQLSPEKDDLPEQNIVNLAGQIKNNVKGMPFSRLSTVRMVPMLRSMQKDGGRRKSKKKTQDNE